MTEETIKDIDGIKDGAKSVEHKRVSEMGRFIVGLAMIADDHEGIYTAVSSGKDADSVLADIEAAIGTDKNLAGNKEFVERLRGYADDFRRLYALHELKKRVDSEFDKMSIITGVLESEGRNDSMLGFLPFLVMNSMNRRADSV